ncbi:17141_t:CDS:10, partial [Cetraspora pellucida]
QLGANLRHNAVGQAGNIVIPAHTVFDEDWSFANGHPTNHIVNLPNANGGQSIVADEIRLGQLCKLARLASIDEQQIRLQFIHELEEIERYKTEQLSGAYLYSDTDKSYRKDNNPLGLDTNISRFIQWLTGEIPEFVPVPKPDLSPKPAIKKVLQSNNPQGLEVTDNDPNSSKPKSSHRKTKTKSRTQKKKSNETFSDSSDSENSTISSENELETNTLARSYNESESDSSRTSEFSNSESDEDQRSTKVPGQDLKGHCEAIKLLAKNQVMPLIKRIVKIDPKAPEEMQPEAEISWPNPIEINFICKIIPNNVATITCQITSPSGKNIQVPGVLIDSGANCSLKSKESIGTCYNVPITFGYRDNSYTITEDFPVMDDDKPWILLGTPLLDHAGWEPIVKHEFKLIHKGKVITIPLSVHKSQREIFKPEINLTFHKQDESKTRSSASSIQVSTDSSSSFSKDNNILLEEWHASAGFSPDFSLSSKDDFLQNISGYNLPSFSSNP